MSLSTNGELLYAPPIHVPEKSEIGDRLDRMQAAAGNGDLAKVVSLMEEVKSIPSGTQFLYGQGGPLYSAVHNGNGSIVEYIFSHGAVFHLKLAEQATQNKDIPILQILLNHGWNINEPLDKLRPSILCIAILDEELTKWFLAHGANPNEGCMLDVTPLSYAVEFATFEVIKLLFNQCGSIECGQLLHYAAYRKSQDQAEVLAYLVEKGLNVNSIMYQNRMDKYNMQKNWSLGTPLHRAAERGRLIGAKWLVEHGGNPRIRDSLGQLPIDRAEAWSRSDVADYLRPITEAASEPDTQWTDGRQGKSGPPIPDDAIYVRRKSDD